MTQRAKPARLPKPSEETAAIVRVLRTAMIDRGIKPDRVDELVMQDQAVRLVRRYPGLTRTPPIGGAK